MKALLFVTRLDLGGAQETCLEQCRILLSHGHEVHLLTAPDGDLLTDARRIPGLAVHAWDRWHHAVRPAADLRCLLRLVAWLRRERFDLLHTHSSKAGLVGRMAAWIAGSPPRVVHHVHGWSFNATQSLPIRWAFMALERLAARRGFVLLACSAATERKGREASIGRDDDRRTIHYGIHRPPLLRRRNRRAARRRLALGSRDLLFLQLGNLKAQKDPVTFARAAAIAGRQMPRARFWIAGDGPLKAQTNAVAERGGLGDRFRVLGWRRDVPDLLTAADVLVLTSRFEGLPLAVLRGMAAGLPVVATAVDGTPEAVEHGRSGILIAPGDAEAAAEAFMRLGRSPRLRRTMGARGRCLSARFASGRSASETLRLWFGHPDLAE